MKLLLLFCLLPSALSVRLINPNWEELIRHVLLEADSEFEVIPDEGTETDILDRCEEGTLTDPFPQFICPLLILNSMSQAEPSGPIDSTTAAMFNRSVNLTSHPCDHKADQSCVTLFLPLNRILFGCAQIDGEILQAPANFSRSFVVPHQVADRQKCEFDSFGKTVCSMESVFLKRMILQEQHSCCCDSGQCAVLYFDQGSSVLPFIRMVMDVDEVLDSVEVEKRRRKREIDYLPLSNAVAETDLTIFFMIVLMPIVATVMQFFFLQEDDQEDAAEAAAYGFDSRIIMVRFNSSPINFS